jgi:hypothetical protein
LAFFISCFIAFLLNIFANYFTRLFWNKREDWYYRWSIDS